ncbi:hypothetical protein MHH84_11005 [Bacillus sp. FSL K6-1109]|uniref:hypothetical protein n=1 Tax=Bacillus TaxID=1386 RepID=UPI0001F44462|nr:MULTISPECIES: hypothetical protein [Bacillus]EFV72323.1 hypothetical protein HMPREF1012_01040 [Bacillus sp. BT1B_CT2]MCY9156248.1 hypothetical protein [Bacillus haynesii]MCY9450333.1 hypothetical protein [Bacillus haynesii]MDQ9095443.1 hypothetical protein [Bacillus licheniformis]MEC0476983.1 hypothetical protein [Bacillus licheniformis]
MTKQYIIKDLQTGDFSHHTTVDDLFEDLVKDYLSNDWTNEEAEEFETKFKQYTEDEKIDFVQDEYEYKLIEYPTPQQIAEWEEFTGRKWEEAKEPNRVFVVYTLHIRDRGRGGHTWGIKGVFYDRHEANKKAIAIRNEHIEEWYTSKNDNSYEVYEFMKGLNTSSVESDNSSFEISVTEEYCE